MNRTLNFRGGFTLIEMMTATAIGSIVLVAVVTSYIFSVKGFRALSAYAQTRADGRMALDLFSCDVRGGSAISSCTTSQVTLVLPTAFDASGNATASNLVSHSFSNGAWYRTVGAGSSKLVATNVASLSFTLYDASNGLAQVSSAVAIQVEVILLQQSRNLTQSEDIVSARFHLRNKP
jgi:prepilin-type N-terminal cleavage/methylation domain-containing protein